MDWQLFIIKCLTIPWQRRLQIFGKLFENFPTYFKKVMRKNYWRCTEKFARHIQLRYFSHWVVKLLHWRPSFHKYFPISNLPRRTNIHTHTWFFEETHALRKYLTISTWLWKRKSWTYSTLSTYESVSVTHTKLFVLVFFGHFCFTHIY